MGVRESVEFAHALQKYADERAHAGLPRWKALSSSIGCGRTTAFRILRGDIGRMSCRFADKAAAFLPLTGTPRTPRALAPMPKFPEWTAGDEPVVSVRKALSLASIISAAAWADCGLVAQIALRRHTVSGAPLSLDLDLAHGSESAAISVYAMDENGTRLRYWSPGGRLEFDGRLSPVAVRRVLRHARTKLKSKTPKS